MTNDEMGWACGTHGRQDRCIQVLVGRPEGNRPLGRPRHRLEDIIETDSKKWDGEAWIGFIWLRIGALGGACECGNEHSGSKKCGEFLDCLRNC
jgi:hypothetical protein